MVVLVIDQDRVLFIKGEGQAPVAADFDGPMALEITRQSVQRPAWHIHIRGRLCVIQKLKPVCKPLGMSRNDASLASCPEELLDARVPEAFDHVVSVAHHASGGKDVLQPLLSTPIS